MILRNYLSGMSARVPALTEVYCSMTIALRFRAVIAVLLFSVVLIAAVPYALRSQTPPKILRFAVYGDTRDGEAIHRKIVAQIVKTKPDFVIQTGDLVRHAS